MLKLKIELQASKTPLLYTLSKCTVFPLCFKSSLNSCRELHSFNFIGRFLHKILPLKFNEFIPYL